MAVLASYIVPHPPLIVGAVGRGEEKKIQKTVDSYHAVSREIASLQPETIVVISPHAVAYEDYFHIASGKGANGDFSAFGAGDVSLYAEFDEEFIDALSNIAQKKKLYAGTMGTRQKKLDHGVMVPLYFIHQYLQSYQIVVLSISGFSYETHFSYGKCIAEAAETLQRDIVIIASGDLSHKLKEDGPYGFAQEGVEFDKKITDAMSKGDFSQFLSFEENFVSAAAECGLKPCIVMAGALETKKVDAKLYSYEGPFGVGYAVASYKVINQEENSDMLKDKGEFQTAKKTAEIKEEHEDSYVKLARQTLETYILENRIIEPSSDLEEELLRRKAGVFVTLKKNGQLRGCIGTIVPTEDNIAGEIIQNAISAGIYDPRFHAVTKEELAELVYSVDVLGQAEPVNSTDELDPYRYGVIVSYGRKKGLLLPNLEGVDNVEEQIEIAVRKAGILPHEPYKIERFEVVRHK